MSGRLVLRLACALVDDIEAALRPTRVRRNHRWTSL